MSCVMCQVSCVIVFGQNGRIVPNILFDSIAGTSSVTFPNFNHVVPRDICVERNFLIALLQNETWNKYLMLREAGQYPNSGRCYLLLLDGAAYL